MLADPDSEDANGCEKGYLRNNNNNKGGLVSRGWGDDGEVEEASLLFKPGFDDAGLDVNESDKAKNLAFLLSVRLDLGKMVVELGQALHEFVARGDAFELFGHKRLCGHGAVAVLEHGERVGVDDAGENGELAGNVTAVQVVGWMGFLFEVKGGVSIL